MAKMQKEDREVVQGVIQDITDFSDAITEVMGRLKAAVADMSDVWKDAQYSQFQDYIDELNNNVNSDLAELDEAREDLARRLALYD